MMFLNIVRDSLHKFLIHPFFVEVYFEVGDYPDRLHYLAQSRLVSL